MNKFIISFDYSYNVINLEFMLNICNDKTTRLARVYINKIKKKIKLYVEIFVDEKTLYEKIELYSIYKCYVEKETEEKLLHELNKTDVVVFDMQYMLDIYNIFMLMKMCN